MATKLKNKHLSTTTFIIAALLFGYSVVSALNFLIYHKNIMSTSYFTSNEYRWQLHQLSYDVYNYHIPYKDFSEKTTDERITAKEIEEKRAFYQETLERRIEEINNEYVYIIDFDSRESNKEWFNLLTEQKTQKLEDAKRKYSKSLEEIKKELEEQKEATYDRLKNNLNARNGIEYYITDIKSGEVYTNISEAVNISDYLNTKTHHYDKFPAEAAMDKGSAYERISTFFINNSLEGYFIIPSANESYNPFIRFNVRFMDIRQRLIDEGFYGGLALAAALVLFIISILTKPHDTSKGNTLWLYMRLPLDIRIISAFLATGVYVAVLSEVSRSLFDIPIVFYIIYCLGTAVFFLFILYNLRGLLRLIKTKESFTQQWRETLVYSLWKFLCQTLQLLGDSSLFKLTLVNAAAILGATFFFGVFFAALIMGSRPPVIVYLYMLGYIVLIPWYVLKQVSSFNKILKGTDEIATGNLNYSIEEAGSRGLMKLASNINNMKAGFKKSLENEMKSERLKSELITNVSHDLKTPLTSIINYVDLLKKDGMSLEETQGYIAVLERKAQRLKVLIEDLFEASKMASGSVELTTERVDIGALLNQTLAELSEKIEASTLIFKVNAERQKYYASLDGKKTWRVFENLLNNILKYSQPNTRVYINLTKTGSKIVLTMKNISAYEMDFDVTEIFDRFKRGDSSRHTEGSGLGLAIAKSIVELQGGSLRIELDGDLFKAVIEFLPIKN